MNNKQYLLFVILFILILHNLSNYCNILLNINAENNSWLYVPIWQIFLILNQLSFLSNCFNFILAVWHYASTHTTELHLNLISQTKASMIQDRRRESCLASRPAGRLAGSDDRRNSLKC